MPRNRRPAILLGLGLLTFSFLAHAQQLPAYRVQALSDRGQLVEVNAINSSGTIAGQANGYFNYAFTYSGGAIRNLGTLQYESNVQALNQAGEAVGYSFIQDIAPFGVQRAVYFSGAGVLDLGTLGGQRSWANDIDNFGQIVGWAERADGTRSSFLYSNGSMQDIGAVLGIAGDNEALLINDAGQVVLRDASRSLLYSDGALHDIGSLLPGATRANAMNEAGRIVGTSGTVFAEHAFTYANGGMVDLGVLSGTSYSAAWDINNHDQIVGTSGARAFLFSGGSMLDLNLLLDPSTPLALYEVLQEAVAINDAGWIVAHGTRGGIYLLTPVPLPAALWLFSGAVAVLGALGRRKS